MQYHRVLVPPGGDAWTVFIAGPRYKTWGFLAHPDTHRFPKETLHNEFERAPIARGTASDEAACWDEQADVSFISPVLEYREFTHLIQPIDDVRWWLTAPKGMPVQSVQT